MDLNLTFRHMNSSIPIRRHINDRMEKLKKHSLKLESVHIVLESEKFRRKAEISLTDNGNRITAIDESSDIYQAIDGAIAKIETQLRKHKSKIQSHKSNL